MLIILVFFFLFRLIASYSSSASNFTLFITHFGHVAFFKRRGEVVLSSSCLPQGLQILEYFLGGWGSVPALFIVFQSFLCIACNPLPNCQAPFNTKERRWGKGVLRKNIPINSPLEQNCFPNTQLLLGLDASDLPLHSPPGPLQPFSTRLVFLLSSEMEQLWRRLMEALDACRLLTSSRHISCGLTWGP